MYATFMIKKCDFHNGETNKNKPVEQNTKLACDLNNFKITNHNVKAKMLSASNDFDTRREI